MAFVSLSKTLIVINCFSSPGSMNGDSWGRRWYCFWFTTERHTSYKRLCTHEGAENTQAMIIDFKNWGKQQLSLKFNKILDKIHIYDSYFPLWFVTWQKNTTEWFNIWLTWAQHAAACIGCHPSSSLALTSTLLSRRNLATLSKPLAAAMWSFKWEQENILITKIEPRESGVIIWLR